MRRVVKVGGSLLPRLDLPRELASWLAAQVPAETLIIVGGGQLIDAIRDLDTVRPGDSVAVHWRCVDLLGTMFECFADWFPSWPAVRTPQEFADRLKVGFPVNRPTLVAVSAFYSPQNDFALPTDWRTTTDAIAAALAIESAADELVLLKSCDVDQSLSIERLAAAGVVDEAMPLIANRIDKIRVARLSAISE